jgi:hypothetical protein
MRRVTAFAVTLLLGLILQPREATAQSIDPGMNKSQVIERLGKPFAERTSGAFTYLFYSNGREQTAGMSDLVILQHDAVVDAIFRSPSRSYSGSSSSPEGVIPAKSAPGGERLGVPVAQGITPMPPSPAPAAAPYTGAKPPPDSARVPAEAPAPADTTRKP